MKTELKRAVPFWLVVAMLAAVGFSPGTPSAGGPDSVAGPEAAEPSRVMLAQMEEGDIDESFEAYGDDSDEIFEYDDALLAPLDSLVEGIRWLGHASFLIETDAVIYIDPYDIAQELADALPKADFVLVTHDHGDHFSQEAIESIGKASTMVISIQAVTDDLPEAIKHSRTVAPGDTITVGDIRIAAVPAYNIEKAFHPKEKGYVGFVVHLKDRTIYHAGDTDLIPEMEQITADIALLPVGGTYTMDAVEAAEAAGIIRPKVAIPMHWGKIVGTWEDAKDFQARSETRVLVPKEAVPPRDN